MFLSILPMFLPFGTKTCIHYFRLPLSVVYSELDHYETVPQNLYHTFKTYIISKRAFFKLNNPKNLATEACFRQNLKQFYCKPLTVLDERFAGPQYISLVHYWGCTLLDIWFYQERFAGFQYILINIFWFVQSLQRHVFCNGWLSFCCQFCD